MQILIGDCGHQFHADRTENANTCFVMMKKGATFNPCRLCVQDVTTTLTCMPARLEQSVYPEAYSGFNARQTYNMQRQIGEKVNLTKSFYAKSEQNSFGNVKPKSPFKRRQPPLEEGELFTAKRKKFYNHKPHKPGENDPDDNNIVDDILNEGENEFDNFV